MPAAPANVTLDDLLRLVGAKEVRIALLERELAEVSARYEALVKATAQTTESE